MSSLVKIFTSSVGKKFVMAITGIAWVGFLMTHLLGNLALYKANGAPYNEYSDMLISLGWLLYVAEAGLVVLLLGHVISALNLTLTNRRARPQRYQAVSSKGGPSKKNLSSMTMIFTGLFILGFIILHIWQFKYGPAVTEGYVTDIKGRQVRDIHRLVVEIFHIPFWVVFYVIAMTVLGFHLRHGFWSALQSLGIAGNKVSRQTSLIGVALAVILSVGFLFIPIWIYLDLPGRFL